jgi:hypothetical protein
MIDGGGDGRSGAKEAESHETARLRGRGFLVALTHLDAERSALREEQDLG